MSSDYMNMSSFLRDSMGVGKSDGKSDEAPHGQATRMIQRLEVIRASREDLKNDVDEIEGSLDNYLGIIESVNARLKEINMKSKPVAIMTMYSSQVVPPPEDTVNFPKLTLAPAQPELQMDEPKAHIEKIPEEIQSDPGETGSQEKEPKGVDFNLEKLRGLKPRSDTEPDKK